MHPQFAGCSIPEHYRYEFLGVWEEYASDDDNGLAGDSPAIMTYQESAVTTCSWQQQNRGWRELRQRLARKKNK